MNPTLSKKNSLMEGINRNSKKPSFTHDHDEPEVTPEVHSVRNSFVFSRLLALQLTKSYQEPAGI